MGNEMLASRSGEKVELIAITVLVRHYCSPCLVPVIYLSLLHIVALSVLHAMYICPSRTVACSLSTDNDAIYVLWLELQRGKIR